MFILPYTYVHVLVLATDINLIRLEYCTLAMATVVNYNEKTYNCLK
jgi:hypothetical protein